VNATDISIIVIIVLAIVLAVVYSLSRKNYKKVIEAEDFIKANKQVASIFVIDKRYEKPTEKNVGKLIYEKLENSAKRRKMCMVKAKVGPQIVTLICDKNLYDIITPKKTIKVELSGLYIVNIVGVNLANKKKKTWREKITLFTKSDSKDVAKKIIK